MAFSLCGLKMEKTSDQISVAVGIILYKNDATEVRRCLDGLKAQAGKHLVRQVLIRDQGGGEALNHVRAWIEDNPGELPISLTEGENVGFGRGHNEIFRGVASEAMSYLCLNPDGVMHPDCLMGMVKLAEKNNWRGIFEAQQEPVMHPKTYDPQSGVTSWCSGACLMIPAAIYRTTGGYDDDFFLYCEDVDLSWRVKAAGYDCFLCSDAFFFHYAMDRSAREAGIWRSACILAHKWRAARFKEHAFNTLASLIDVSRQDLIAEVEALDRRTLQDVYKARPDFSHGLTFALPMWADR